MSCVLIAIVTIRTRREKDKSRKEKAIILAKPKQEEEYLITSQKDKKVNEVTRFSVPNEKSSFSKPPRHSIASNQSDDNRETAASAIDRPATTIVDLEIEEEKIEVEF